MNGLFQAARARARGYRNVGFFITMIYLRKCFVIKFTYRLTNQAIWCNSIRYESHPFYATVDIKSKDYFQSVPKGTAAQRDFDLLDANDSFGVSWTGGEVCEPGAATHEIRRDNLIFAKQCGIRTWISCEPVIVPAVVFGAIRHFNFVDMFRIGKLNHIKSPIDWPAFGRKAEALCIEYGRAYYIKEDLRKAMEVPA
jgi:hypothetical protein